MAQTLAITWAILIGDGCTTPCSEVGCKSSLSISVKGVVPELLPNDAYEAVICIEGDCVEATFTRSPTTGPCDVPGGDGSLCCKTSWATETPLDCHANGADLELTLPLKASTKAGSQAVVLSVIDSEGDESLRDETKELPPPSDPACPNDCRDAHLAF